ncbi:glycoside hydrolase family 6 protein [Pseudonocardia lacus]|uniref:glycoside hydrolase family 6 protein n=1 Tax=Pseudonocardia lacus TaxID=2835865 RepID=UPI001BDCEB39|nr:glycoside hydrolase family 6 protein [Pseudonocardia lacus]
MGHGMRAAVACALAALVGCAVPGGEAVPGSASTVTALVEPSAGAIGDTDFFVDPQSAPARQVREYTAAGRTADAAQLDEIARQPLPFRPAGEPDRAALDVRDYVGRASEAGQQPLLVVADLGGEPCAADPEAYRARLDPVIAGLGDTSSTVVLEPGAAAATTACPDARALLADAVTVLASAGATVYLDAGPLEPGSDLNALAVALRGSGVAEGHGFSVNVGATRSTEEAVALGSRLSALLDGAPFVVDTSRNGAPDGAATSCNPPQAALGPPPTTRTGTPGVDAFLWIAVPGASDGACRPGEPPAGQWWPEYALGVAERSR